MKNIDEIINTIICGDALSELKKIQDESINCIITSPPYFNLRDYNISGQIGLESTWQDYIKKLIDIFNEIKRVLKKEGTCFVNLGDTFAGGGYGACTNLEETKQGSNFGTVESRSKICEIRKQNKQISQKSLMMIPHRFAIAMTNNDWQLRDDLTEEERKYVLTELVNRDIL